MNISQKKRKRFAYKKNNTVLCTPQKKQIKIVSNS